MLILSLALIACLNETTMAHDEAMALVAKARTRLEKAEYADAARIANGAAAELSRRVSIGEGEADREPVARHKDVAALATARMLVVAAITRSNGAIDARGNATHSPAQQVEAYQHAFALLLKARKASPKNDLFKQIEGELQVRSGNLRAQGKATLLDLGKRDLLGAPESLAALATVLDADGDGDEARRYRALCAARAARPSQCEAFPPGIATGGTVAVRQ